MLALDELVPELLPPGLLAAPRLVLDQAGVETDEFVALRLLMLPLLVLEL